MTCVLRDPFQLFFYISDKHIGQEATANSRLLTRETSEERMSSQCRVCKHSNVYIYVFHLGSRSGTGHIGAMV